MMRATREMVSFRAHLAVHLAVACFVICSNIATADNLGKGFCFRQRRNGKCNGLMETFPGSAAKISTADECCSQGGAGWAERNNGRRCLDSCNGKIDLEQLSPEEDVTRVEGVLGEWGEWMPCSVSCGEGIVQRQRQCICESPDDTMCCDDQVVEQEPCNTNVLCPVHGQWGDWSNWGECSATCGETMTRKRECNSPRSEHGGDDCMGDHREVAWCNNRRHCPVDGRWRAWSSWSLCSATCGRRGTQNRYRSCTAPKPGYGGLDCEGDVNVQRPCSAPANCPIDGEWSEWKNWHCPEGCVQGGEGHAWRLRYCSNPFPKNGGKQCEGEKYQSAPCSNSICAVDGAWEEWSSWSECSSSCGTNRFRSRKRQCDNQRPHLGGYPCHGSKTEQQSCNDVLCEYKPEDYDNSQWPGSDMVSDIGVPCDDEDLAEGGSGCGTAAATGSGDGGLSDYEQPEYVDTSDDTDDTSSSDLVVPE